MRFRKQGFTLAELLIVIAVIAVLTAVAIPAFSAMQEKGRESTDAANIRSLYLQVMTAVVSAGGDVNADGADRITLKQKKDGWQNENIQKSLSELAAVDGAPAQGGGAWVSFDADSETVTIHFDGGSGGSGGGGGDTYPAGHEIALTGSGFSSVSSGSHTLRINSPVATTVYIEVVVHAGGSPNSAVKQRIQLTILPGEHDYPIDVDKNNGSLGISFNEEISQSDANALVGSIQMVS